MKFSLSWILKLHCRPFGVSFRSFRLPTTYAEPNFETEWRRFSEEWQKRTGNGLQLNQEMIYMGYGFTFLDTEEAKQKKAKLLEKTGDENLSELEYLLHQETSSVSFLKKTKQKMETKESVKV